ncbi:MAG: sn-glycerol-3-phosphate ABC transporter ATP-binding protein UgpC [Pseudomonadota bacterium]
MGAVQIRDVYKSYRNLDVLHGVSLDIADGEFVVLVGPSGCGKSTLLRMIAGLEDVTSGEIWINGRLVNDLAPKKRDISMVFQSYALYPHMTVEENMGFSLKLARVERDETMRRVANGATMLGLADFLNRFPRHLSGGQRQRVAMGRAIVRDPSVFLFDEPLSNLDAKLRVQMRFEIKQNHQRMKTTTVYVTHDQIEAMTMADRIVVLHDGRIEQIGTPADLYDRPDNLFVAGFIGSPAMNLLEGKVVGGDFVTAAGALIRVKVPAKALPEQKITLGIRPENLHLDPTGLPAEVLSVEPTGAETQVTARMAGHVMVGAFRERIRAKPGETLSIRLDSSALHLFDSLTGQRLSNRAAD